MLKKLLMPCIALVVCLWSIWAAAVEVNTADEATLESVKGIGPTHAKAIIDERTKNGPFKNADDLAARVKGLGTKSVTNLEAAGLTINGSSVPPGGAGSSAKSTGTKAVKPAASTSATTAATGANAPAAGAANMTGKSNQNKAMAPQASASATAMAAASGPSGASGTKPGKTKKAKKNKAASATAASGA
jgi:competence protein ComEA